MNVKESFEELNKQKQEEINVEITQDLERQEQQRDAGMPNAVEQQKTEGQKRIFEDATVQELLMDQNDVRLTVPEYEIDYHMVNEYSQFKHAPVLTEKDSLSEEALREQRKWRDYITQKFRLDDLVRQDIEREDLTLKEVVDIYFSEEEKLRVSHTTEEHLKEFQKIREAVVRDNVLTADEKAETLFNLTRIFAGDFAKYKALYAEKLAPGKRKDRIIKSLEVFEMLMKLYDPEYAAEGQAVADKTALFKILGISNKAHEDTFGEADSIMLKIKDRARFLNRGKRQQKTPEQLEKEKEANKVLSENLTAEQKRSILKIDYLMVSEAAKYPGHISFLNKVLQLPPRKRLYMYYVIQHKGHLEAPGHADAGLSQLGYVPDVKVVADRLTKVPYRVWEVMSPDGLHSFMWEKVEAAYAQIQRQDVANNVLFYAKKQGINADKILEEERKKNQDNANDAQGEEVDAQLKKDANTAFELEKERDVLLVHALKAAEECQEAVNARDKAMFVTRWYKQRKVDEKSAAVQEAMRNLKQKDDNLAQRLSAFSKKNYKVGFKEEESKIKGDMVYASSQSLTLMSKMNLIPKLFSDEIGAIGVQQGLDARIDLGLLPNADISLNGLLKGINYTSGVLGTLSGCVNLYASLKGVDSAIKMIKSGDYASDLTALTALKATRGVVAGTYGICAGATNFAYASRVTDLMMGNKALATSVGAMKTGLQVVGGAVSGAGLLLDGVDAAMQVRQEVHRLEAMYYFHYAKKELRKSNTEEAKADEMYISNMMSLDRRNKIRNAVSTTASIGANSIGLAAAITTCAGLGIGLAVGALAVSLTSKIIEYKMKSSNKKTSVEQFLQTDDLSWLNLPKDVKITSETKKQIMEHLAAEMGFTTIKGLFNHVVRKYASFVYEHLFFKKDGSPILYRKPEDDDMVDGCYQFVKGLGLHVEYPMSVKDAERERHPSLAAICGRLGC